MSELKKRLLQNRFLVVTMGVALLSLALLYVAQTTFNVSDAVARPVESVAIAFLTSGVVGFVFEYLTRSEFTDVIHDAVRTELERRLVGQRETVESLWAYWRPFVSDGAYLIIAQDESGDDSTMRAADVSCAQTIQEGLLERFWLPGDSRHTRIKPISKSRPVLGELDYDRHLIVIGGPGANPLAEQLINILRHVSLPIAEIRNGFVFAMNTTEKPYLRSIYLVSAGEDPPGIWEMQSGVVIRRFERRLSTRRDVLDSDACLITTGTVMMSSRHPFNVLVISGHSRASTMAGVRFVLSSEGWAAATLLLKERAGESVLSIKGSTLDQNAITILAQPPRPIQKYRD